ncbi:MAG TPA: hypothetical protein VNG33_21330 [Polyangiaceae bacterium]|nr:hypothetical protein [Polyangiaceae bacterium]
MNSAHVNWLGRVIGSLALTSLAVCTACNVPCTKASTRTRVDTATAPSIAAEAPAPAKPATNSAPPAAVPALNVASLPVLKGASKRAEQSTLQIKRFVVASAVKDREPLVSGDALPSDGSAIYAFAELANPKGSSENVRITFERKAGAERVGDVTLPVPANVSRHRTWAFTRFIRAAGVWEAVLWAEDGTELGRASFEVKAS